jgi:uncharacterized membrane protein YkoI
MPRANPFAVALVAVSLLAPARAEEGALPQPGKEAALACLDQKERRAVSESHKLVSLAVAMRAAKSRMPGTIVQVRLCRRDDRLVYVLTVLAHDGKVARLTVDAVKGTLVGGL